MPGQPQARAALGRQNFRIPGGDSRVRPWCRCWSSPIHGQRQGPWQLPAITHIACCLFEGCLLDIDSALQVESRYFAACIVSRVRRT